MCKKIKGLINVTEVQNITVKFACKYYKYPTKIMALRSLYGYKLHFFLNLKIQAKHNLKLNSDKVQLQ